MERAVGVATETGETGTGAAGVGLKLKVTERLDLGYVFGTDSGCTVDFTTRLDDEFRTVLDDEVDNEEGCSQKPYVLRNVNIL